MTKVSFLYDIERVIFVSNINRSFWELFLAIGMGNDHIPKQPRAQLTSNASFEMNATLFQVGTPTSESLGHR